VSALHELTLTDALSRIAAHELDPAAIIEACLARISDRERELQAWACVADADTVRAEAARARSLPLAGLPVGVKDVIDVAAFPTRHGSPLHAERAPACQDAAAVALLRAAGLVPLGKAQTSEFAYLEPAPTLNPSDPARTPGGSSSGPAAAVADGMVPVALGTQTAGSVIRPASYCGVVAYVAGHGELPLQGVQPLAPSLDSLGIFARCVEDVRTVRVALTGAERAALPPPPRVALFDGAPIHAVDDAMRGAQTAAVTAFTRSGATVQKFEEVELLVEAAGLHHVVMAYEARRALAAESEVIELLSRPLQELLRRGAAVGHRDYRVARIRLRGVGAQVAAAFAGIEAVLAPAAPGEAPPRERGTGSPELSRPWQALGLPALALPVTPAPGGLPVGVQLVGPAFADDALLALGAWAEVALSDGAGDGIVP
jgi:Asp-tRNA(Asn)/Glu-tRNA(Gln) amidotransferase A subunit family amidase